jgi:hypothetical protein
VSRSRKARPSRRRVLQLIGMTVVGLPILKQLGAVIDVRVKKLKPEDLSSVPWIGHC